MLKWLIHEPIPVVITIMLIDRGLCLFIRLVCFIWIGHEYFPSIDANLFTELLSVQIKFTGSV